MSSHFVFLEITNFNLDDLIPHLGWIGAKPVKIYTRGEAVGYYLYDEEIGRLFEFRLIEPNGDNSNLQYDQILEAYRHRFN